MGGCISAAPFFFIEQSAVSIRQRFLIMELRVKRAPRIDTEIGVPGDKSISHRAVIIASLSNGICKLEGFLPSEDCTRTVNAMRALGIKIEQPEPETLVVHGKKRMLAPPKEEIDCGNSA